LRGIAEECGEVTGLVDEREDDHAPGANLVDQTVTADEQLPDGRIVEFTDAPAAVREVAQRCGCILRTHGKRGCVTGEPCAMYSIASRRLLIADSAHVIS
jgi:hypothetical protein